MKNTINVLPNGIKVIIGKYSDPRNVKMFIEAGERLIKK